MYIQYIKMLAVEFFVKSQALKAESDIKIIKIESNEFACWDLYILVYGLITFVT
jgi:hypothetical protein